MSNQSEAVALLERFYASINSGDPEAALALFAPGAAYEEPGARGASAADEFLPALERLQTVISDLRVECEAALVSGTRASVAFRICGENLTAIHAGLVASKRRVELAGVDLFELGAERILSLRRCFDHKELAEQLGLMALIQPVEQGRAKFGYAMRVPSGNPKPPGVIALTYIQAGDETEKERIRAHARQNVQDFLREPGFISIVTGFTGLRGFTVTAWEDEAALQRALSQHHAVAMKELFGQNFVASVWTSVWLPSRINRIWLRCPACAALEDVSDDHRSCRRCQAALPERPPFW